MAEFDLAATGGTFDIIHAGHLALLSKALEVSRGVIVGLTSDEMARRRGKAPLHSYAERLGGLERELGLLARKAGERRSFHISRLDDDFGPAVLEPGVQALVVSEETRPQGGVLNSMRAEMGLSPVEIVAVPMVLAADGRRISSTRVRNSEISARGDLRH